MFDLTEDSPHFPIKPANIWILNVLFALRRLVPSLLVSSLIVFYIPVLVIGIYLQNIFGVRILSLGVSVSLFWLAVAPFLIFKAYDSLRNFFHDHKEAFSSEQDWISLFEKYMRLAESSRYSLLGTVWALCTSITITVTIFADVPLAVKIWAFFSYFLLFYVSAIGFYGIYVLMELISEVCTSNITFNPYHPDQFGGISGFGRFSAKFASYFSSGALVFPLVFEMTLKIGSSSATSTYVTLLLTGIFVGTMAIAFLKPIFLIKERADKEKRRITLESRNHLDALMARFNSEQRHVIQNGLDVIMYYNFYHLELTQRLKDYPFDFKVIFQFVASTLVPILMAAVSLIKY